MLSVSLAHSVTPATPTALKAAAARQMDDVRQPTHRLECLARALGFRTWAALQAQAAQGQADRRAVTLAPALAYAEEKDLDVTPYDLHATWALATKLRVASETPEIHADGWGRKSCWPRPTEAYQITTNAAPGRVFQDLEAAADSRLAERRKAWLEEHFTGGILRAMAFCSATRPASLDEGTLASSRELYLRAGEIAYDLGDGLRLFPDAVGHANLMAAAVDRGLKVRHVEPESPNLVVAVPQADLDRINAAFETADSLHANWGWEPRGAWRGMMEDAPEP